MSYAPFLTASAVDRFLLCPASATLPKVYSESAAATAGTEAHARILRPGGLPASVLRWRYLDEEKLAEIGRRLGVSEARAQQLVVSSLAQLRRLWEKSERA